MPGPKRRTHLSSIEIAVMDRVAVGKTNAEIAGELGRSFFTVKSHVERILYKLGATNRTEAAVLYVQPRGFEK